ncbi:MAG: hypothetical protein JF603_03895 [Acidobacteria bacterium]|nr:hypothetical protein [Acidobacteriota bacterium]
MPWAVHGAVAANGAPETDADGWSVSRVSAGHYLLDLGRRRAAVTVTSWDAPTDATVVPYGGGVVGLVFDGAGGGVDTRFRFDAVLRPLSG